MKNKIVLICCVTVLITGLLLIIFLNKDKSVNQNEDYIDNFPETSSNVEPNEITSENTLSLKLVNGEILVVKNFINDGNTVNDVVNPGRYILAGSAGYCLENGYCPESVVSTDGFSIVYDETWKAFNILLQVPIAQNRFKAEQFLLERLGTTKESLCNIEYYVGVTSYVNPEYAGMNLGFSFCPGSVELK